MTLHQQYKHSFSLHPPFSGAFLPSFEQIPEPLILYEVVFVLKSTFQVSESLSLDASARLSGIKISPGSVQFAAIDDIGAKPTNAEKTTKHNAKIIFFIIASFLNIYLECRTKNESV